MSRSKVSQSGVGYVNIASFVIINFVCVFTTFAFDLEPIVLSGNKLSDVQKYWSFSSSVKSSEKPSLYKENLKYLDDGVLENNVWILDSGSELEFQLSSDQILTDYCEVENGELVIKYHADSATGYFEPCKPSNYCFLHPSTKIWTETKMRINDSKAFDSPIRITGIVKPGGYIMFNEISISFDGTEKKKCITTPPTPEPTETTTEEFTPETEATETDSSDWYSPTTVLTTVTTPTTTIPTTTEDIETEETETVTGEPTTPTTEHTSTLPSSTTLLTTPVTTTTSPNASTIIDIRDDIPEDGRWKFDCALGYVHNPEGLTCNGMNVPPEGFDGFGYWTKCGTICHITYTVQPEDTFFSARLFQSKLSSEISYNGARWEYIDGNGWIDVSKDISSPDVHTISLILDNIASDTFTILDKISINTRF